MDSSSAVYVLGLRNGEGEPEPDEEASAAAFTPLFTPFVAGADEEGSGVAGGGGGGGGVCARRGEGRAAQLLPRASPTSP